MRGIAEIFPPDRRQYVEILAKMITENLWIWRKEFIEKQNEKGFQELADRFIKAGYGPERSGEGSVTNEFFLTPFVKATAEMEGGRPCVRFPTCSNVSTNEIGRRLNMAIMRSLIDIYIDWASFDERMLNAYVIGQCKGQMCDFENCMARGFALDKHLELLKEMPDAQEKFMKKLKSTAPHWRMEDRKSIMEMIESNGQGKENYASRLLKDGFEWKSSR